MAVKIAFGFQARMGKDTSVDYLIQKYGGNKISFSKPLYDIQKYAQQRCGLPLVKDRKFLQWVGTEWGRSMDENIWINLALKEARECKGNVYVSDLRFRNEFEALKKEGFVLVKLVRDDPERLKTFGSGTLTHQSEIDLADSSIPWHAIIENNGTLEELYGKLDQLVNVCEFMKKY